jgi:ABC-type dipeptide/oligopeptide/nickel transport system permease component
MLTTIPPAQAGLYMLYSSEWSNRLLTTYILCIQHTPNFLLIFLYFCLFSLSVCVVFLNCHKSPKKKKSAYSRPFQVKPMFFKAQLCFGAQET